MAKKAMKVGTVSAEPGAKAFGSLTVGELNDGSPVNMPVILVNGVKPGPTLYLGAAVHGNELTGVEVIRRIISEIDPQKVSGAIIAVPIQNPLAFEARQKETPHYYQKELTDMWTALPGDPGRGLTEIMTHVLVTEVISKADYVLDFHTGFPAEELAILIPPAEERETLDKEVEMAKAFGIEVIEIYPSGLSALAKSLGNVVIDAELGDACRLDEKYIAIGVRGVWNIMKYLGIIEGKPELPEKQTVFKGRVVIRAKRGGLLITKVKCMQKVSKGDVLACIYNLFTLEEVEQIKVPEEGIILRVMTYPTVNQGDRIAGLGAICDVWTEKSTG